MSSLLRFLNYCPNQNTRGISHTNVILLQGNKYSHNKLATSFKISKQWSSPPILRDSRLGLPGGCHVGDDHCCGSDESIEQYSMAGLQRDKMPKHVAIILDGSRRWLKAHGKPLTYEPFFQSNMLFADLCLKWGVATATSFVYSLKNLQRGKEANDMLFGNLELFLKDNTENFSRKGIRVLVIGERSALPKSLQDKVQQVEETTRDCTKLEFMLAVCYAGTMDIVQATKSICGKVDNGLINVDAIDERLFEQELWTKASCTPAIDLLIRTGGRLRVSDYLMWQLAQAELYFTDISAPEFSEVEFLEAIQSFQHRERTFGK